MRRSIIFIALALLVVVPATAQTAKPDFEKGTAADLKGRTKVFVSSTPRDKSLTKKVIARIEEKLPGITLVNNLGDAEIWVRFYAYSLSETSRTPPDLNTAPRLLENGQTLPGDGQTRFTTEQGIALNGTIIVMRRSDTPKLIMQFSKKGGNRSSLAEKFANEFVRVYQEAAAGP